MRLHRFLAVALLVSCSTRAAFAQSPAGFTQGQVPTVAQWNTLFANKVDVNGGNASAANVTATGSTTARTLAARAADVVNAKDFGVKCDGATDDTADLQTFLSAITSGKKGILPAGTCLFSNTINLPNSYASLFGSGMYSTTLEYTGTSTTADLISFGAQAS